MVSHPPCVPRASYAAHLVLKLNLDHVVRALRVRLLLLRTVIVSCSEADDWGLQRTRTIPRGNVLVWPLAMAVAIWKPVDADVPSDASASVPRPFIDRRALSVARSEFAYTIHQHATSDPYPRRDSLDAVRTLANDEV